MEISGRAIRREAVVAIGCFAAAFITNIVAIIKYDGQWTEAFSQIGFVIVIAAVIFVIVTLIRLLFWLITFSAGKIRGRR